MQIITKYRKDAKQVFRAFTFVFTWLPLGCTIDGKVLVVHGVHFISIY